MKQLLTSSSHILGGSRQVFSNVSLSVSFKFVQICREGGFKFFGQSAGQSEFLLSRVQGFSLDPEKPGSTFQKSQRPTFLPHFSAEIFFPGCQAEDHRRAVSRCSERTNGPTWKKLRWLWLRISWVKSFFLTQFNELGRSWFHSLTLFLSLSLSLSLSLFLSLSLPHMTWLESSSSAAALSCSSKKWLKKNF